MTQIRKVTVRRLSGDNTEVPKEDLFEKALKLAKKGKLKEAKKTLKKASVQNYMERFVSESKEKKIDEMLDSVENIIKAMKVLYENGKEFISDKLYDITLDKFKAYREEPVEAKLFIVGRRTKDAEHKYPLLRGTLDKAKYIYTRDNEEKKNNVKDVESFLRKCNAYAKSPLRVRTSLKYDGVSLTEDIDKNTGKVLSGISRGDDGEGTDLTHLLQHITYKNAINESFNYGLKTELIMTQANYEAYSKERGKTYANLRSAVVSVISASKGAKYAKYLTPVPLYAVTDTGEEVPYSIINKLFATNMNLRFREFEENNFTRLLAQVHNFIAEVRDDRAGLGFAIDGVVIDVLNPEVREALGRNGAINQYQVAYKFPPDSVETTVEHFEVTVGRTGLLTPIIFYAPIVLNGTVHNHSTLSSYERFEKMNLHLGDTIRVSYNNDVMPYVEPTVKHNGQGPAIGYPDDCPSCGGLLVREGANYFCRNKDCTVKHLNKIIYFVKALGIKDFADGTIVRLYDEGLLTDVPSIFNMNYSAMLQLDGFGETKVNKIKSEIGRIMVEPLNDYDLCNALGVSGAKTCHQILQWFTLQEVMKNPYSVCTINTAGIKDAKLNKFIDGLTDAMKDLQYLTQEVFTGNLVHSKNNVEDESSKIKVLFTGFRDSELKKLSESKGYKVVDSGFKGVQYVVASNPHDTSKKKIAKALDKGIEVISRAEFEEKVRAS